MGITPLCYSPRGLRIRQRGVVLSLRGFGLKLGHVRHGSFEPCVRELVSGQPMLGAIANAMLAARATLAQRYGELHKKMLDRWSARGDHISIRDR
jgi:hypothetical protein